MQVAIVGGGVMGSSLAWWLTRDPAFAGEVVVIERDPTYARASSTLSASGIRQQFSQPVNVEIGLFGAAFLRDLVRRAGPDDAAIGLHEGGYLYLASEAGSPVLVQNHNVQRSAGADVALLGPAALTERFPWLSTEGIALGSLGLSGEGWFDGYALLRTFRAGAIARGARYLAAEVTAAARAPGGVDRLVLGDGGELAADLVVLAAGPWSGRLGRALDIDIPVHARLRTVFVLDCPEPPRPCPLVIDPAGVWFRPEGRYFLAGAPPLTSDADDLPLEPEHELLEARIWPTLAARVPAFQRLRMVSAWAGYYEVNEFDHNGLVGPWPGIDNLLVATGFSGHGMQQAPAVGRGLAELIVHGRYTTLDLTPLSPDRIARGEPLLERNVI